MYLSYQRQAILHLEEEHETFFAREGGDDVTISINNVDGFVEVVKAGGCKAGHAGIVVG